MSMTITEAFVQQFNRNVLLLCQQMGSKTRGKVRMEMVNATKAFFDRLAPTEPQQKVTRHQDTPLVEQVHSRRAVQLQDWVLADLVDREDQIRMLIDPASLYARNFAMGMGRRFDRTLIAAFTADADTGQFGGTTVVFPAANTIASGASTLTVARVREVKRIFDKKDVPQDGRVWLTSAEAMEGLLGETEVTSSDFNTVKALVQGTIEGNTWMGFEWIVLSDDILPVDGSLDRSNFVYQRDGMAVAMGQDMRTEMDRRPDKMNALQVMSTMSLGAVRVDDDRVLQVLVREAA